MRLFAIIILSLALSSCVGQGPTVELASQVKEQQEACITKYTGNEHAVQRAKCVNEATEPLAKFNPNPDLVNLLFATRVELAEKIQNGKITVAEAQASFAKAVSDAESESQRRQNGSAIAAAQQSAAISASMPRTCYTYGNVTNCF